MAQEPETLFVDLKPGQEVVSIESLCMNCHKKGETRLMMTKIPFFKDLVISSFNCDDCGFKNSETQATGEIQDYGHRLKLNVTKPEDVTRDIVRSEHAIIRIPELDFEIPPAKRGQVTTIEGILGSAIEELSLYQEERRKQMPEQAIQVALFLQKLSSLKDGDQLPFVFEIEDPSGNSFIKNPFAPNEDPQLSEEKFVRSPEQLKAMGFEQENQIPQNNSNKQEQKQPEIRPEYQSDDMHRQKLKTLPESHRHRLDFNKPLEDQDDLKGESHQFPTTCHVCYKDGLSKMCIVSIPFFKELIIMAFTCEHCGAHTSDIKTGGGIGDQAKVITLKATHPDDLHRDVFKSESARLSIPEIDLVLEYGTLGGKYTTVEGLVESILENFKKNNPFMGDSDKETKDKINHFYQQLEDLKEGKKPFTLIMEDPLDNSFLQNIYYPEPDQRVTVEQYDRTEEQNDEFGLNYIKTENYQ